jgi:DNA-binding PucR family transcriptional regulator
MRPDESRRRLLAGLRQRREEIEQAVTARVRAIDDPAGKADPEYLDGLRLAIEAAIDHTIEAVEGRQEVSAPVPGAILAQARLAAQRQVRLETMLRRYLAGHTILGDFTADEAERQRVSPDILRLALRSQAARTDQILAAISATYDDEATAIRPKSSERRRTESVRRLLDGELVDPAILDYELNRRHVGFVVSGTSAADAVDVLTAGLGGSRLVINDEADRLWVWIASPAEREPSRPQDALRRGLPDDVRVGIGEPAQGLQGWRLTHKQALAAHSVAVRRSEPDARYADVALLASSLRDELLTTSLRTLYMAPLEGDTTNPEALRETLRAYFAADGNVSSTAAALDISRNTVASRLRAVEEKVGPLRTIRSVQFILALQLNELEEKD